MDEHIARANPGERPHRDELGVTRTRSDKPDGHENDLLDESLEVLLAIVVRRQAALRPRPELAQLPGELGMSRPDAGRKVVAQALGERR